MKLYIYCEEEDFSALSEAFDKETESDLNLSAEIVITDGDEIRRLNRELRGIDAVTDVLSFPSLNLKAGAKLCKKRFPRRYRRGRKSVYRQYCHLQKTRRGAGGGVRTFS